MKRSIPAIVLAMQFALAASAQTANASPVTSDPPATMSPPASMAEIQFQIEGSRTNGLIYRAGGEGAHPVVIFLHGFPGNEKNLDLAQAVRRAGYHAVYAEYRGAWGSAGTFSFSNGLEDVAAIIEWVRDPKNAKEYNLDTSRIALVGHSYGGWLALMSGAKQPSEVCVAALDAWNLGGLKAEFSKNPKAERETMAYFRIVTDSKGGPLRGKAHDLMKQVSRNEADWNYVAKADALKSHAVLSVAATRDDNIADHDALDAAMMKAGAKRLKSLRFEDDHPFSSHRITLAEALIEWLDSDCADNQRPPEK